MTTYRKYFSENDSTQSYVSDGLLKRDVNKLLSFSESPEKYATGTSRAREKIQYLESIKHKFSDGQLATYQTALKKYNATLKSKTESRNTSKENHSIAISEAIANHQSIKIRYKNVWRTVDPYTLNDAYIVTYCHLAHDIRTFRLDRIQGVELRQMFDFDNSKKATADKRIAEAPNYKGYR